METLVPHFKLWLSIERNRSAFGDGKYRLLAHVDRSGSLSAAAQELGISYRKAWGDLRKAEAALGMKLVARVRGGAGGGHMALTADGKFIMAAYARMQCEMSRQLEMASDRFNEELVEHLNG